MKHFLGSETPKDVTWMHVGDLIHKMAATEVTIHTDWR